ncbi:MAG: hypothetical protein JHD16_07010, partial [Solirubrobacteraceae bacterium]|nr:hypothetical protein [Solirubrobacteraceae bacterium]
PGSPALPTAVVPALPSLPTSSPAPPPLIASTIKGDFTVSKGITRVKKLTIRSLPAGGRIAMSCTPASKDAKKKGKNAPCPFKTRANATQRARAKVEFAPLFAGRKLTPGTVITVTVSAPGTNAKTTTFTVQRSKKPTTALS